MSGGASRLPVRAHDARSTACCGSRNGRTRPTCATATGYFDGDAYLRAARRAGGVAALNRALVRAEMRPGDRPRRFRSPGAARAAAAVDWIALLAGDPRVLIKEAFKAIGILAAKKVGTLAAEKAGNAALGWVLAAFGYGDVLKDRDMLEIKEALTALGKQLTALQGQVLVAGFSTLVHQTDRTIGQIDHASSQLALLANMPQGDSTRRAFTQTIVDYIGANLLDAPSILNQNLSSNIPLSDNLIKSASRVVAQKSRFFDSKSSAAVKSVYDYFAAYEVKLALLLTEYYHAKPETFSPTTVKANLDALEANVDAQAGSLKPSVPERAVIDSRTGVMWTQALNAPAQADLHAIAEIFQPRRGLQRFRLKPGAGPTGVAGLPHGDWRVPTSGDFARLIEGWSGKKRGRVAAGAGAHDEADARCRRRPDVGQGRLRHEPRDDQPAGHRGVRSPAREDLSAGGHLLVLRRRLARRLLRRQGRHHVRARRSGRRDLLVGGLTAPERRPRGERGDGAAARPA